jgi:hypothetical protein
MIKHIYRLCGMLFFVVLALGSASNPPLATESKDQTCVRECSVVNSRCIGLSSDSSLAPRACYGPLKMCVDSCPEKVMK